VLELYELIKKEREGQGANKEKQTEEV